MNAAKHYIYKSRLKSSYFLLFNHLRNYKLGSLEIKNFQKNMQSKCVCHPKMPRIKNISYIMVGRYSLRYMFLLQLYLEVTSTKYLYKQIERKNRNGVISIVWNFRVWSWSMEAMEATFLVAAYK